MGKHPSSFRFRPQRHERQTAPTGTSSATTATADLTPERCVALAGELEALQQQIGDAATALRSLAAAGGEGQAPATQRARALTAVADMVEALKHAPEQLARALTGR